MKCVNVITCLLFKNNEFFFSLVPLLLQFISWTNYLESSMNGNLSVFNLSAKWLDRERDIKMRLVGWNEASPRAWAEPSPQTRISSRPSAVINRAWEGLHSSWKGLNQGPRWNCYLLGPALINRFHLGAAFTNNFNWNRALLRPPQAKNLSKLVDSLFTPLSIMEDFMRRKALLDPGRLTFC